MSRLERPTKLSEVLQFCPDNDLDLHLRAIKKAFPSAKINFVEKETPKIYLAHTREKAIKASKRSQQVSLF